MTGDSGIVLVIYAAVASWLAAGLGILALREHHRGYAWRRRTRRIAVVRRLSQAAAVRSGRQPAQARGGPKSRPAVVIRCAVPPPGGDSATEPRGVPSGHVLEARRRGTSQ